MRNPFQEANGIFVLFAQNLAINHIDFYYVMWHFYNA